MKYLNTMKKLYLNSDDSETEKILLVYNLHIFIFNYICNILRFDGKVTYLRSKKRTVAKKS